MPEQKELDRIKQRKVMRKSTFIIFLGVFIASLLTILVVKQSPSIKDRYESVSPTAAPLLENLVGFKYEKQGKYLPLPARPVPGDVLVFKVSVLRPTFIGLLVSVNRQKPTFSFYTRLPPGESRLIERQGERFSYKVRDSDKTLKFCVVYAADKADLQRMSERLALVWAATPEASCLALK